MKYRILLILPLVSFLASGCFGRKGLTVHISVKSSEKQTREEVFKRLGYFDDFIVTRCVAQYGMKSFQVTGFFYGDHWDQKEFERKIESDNTISQFVDLDVSVLKTRNRFRTGTFMIFTLLVGLVLVISGGSLAEADEKRKSNNTSKTDEEPRKLWEYPVAVIALISGCVTVAMIVAVCEMYYAHAIPGIWNFGRGNYIVGGDFHAGTGFMVFVFGALIPAAIECAVLAGLGALTVVAFVNIKIPCRLAAFIAVAILVAVKLGSHHVFTGNGYSMWLAPWSLKGEFGFLSLLYLLSWGLVLFAPIAIANEEEIKSVRA